MLRVGIGVQRVWCAGILLSQWQGENFAHRQHLKVCHFQPVQCASKNAIYPKIFDRFSTSFPQLEDFEGGHLGGKLQLCACILLSAMARWELCASKTFESFPLSTCTLCEKKSYISKGIQPIFEIFASPRRFWAWEFWRKVSGAQVFYFFNGKVRTLRIDNIWKFATFNLYTVPAKILYLQKVFNRFWTSLPQLEDFEGGHMGVKVSGAQVFYFCNGKVKTLPIDNIWKFATFNL